MFKEYLHVERYGTDEVDGIELGEIHAFPKLDGTNASCWLDGDLIGCGSRHRELTLLNDNQGFMEYVWKHETLREFFTVHPKLRLYGEWLVPHTLKTYRDEVWRRFWIFDVFNDSTDTYLAYDIYQPWLEEFKLDYIPPIAKMRNASSDNLSRLLDANVFFIRDGEGTGEGIVLKNYDFLNKYSKLAYAKIVKTEFKEQHSRAMGPPEVGGTLLEDQIIQQFLTKNLSDKTFAKITNEKGAWKSEYIPELLGRVWHDLITEEMWNILKERKFNGSINFKTLRNLANKKVKEHLPQVF